MSSDIFVGRTREFQRFQKFLTRESPWVLIIRGLGGSGKSRLFTEIERLEKLKPADTCIVSLDFAKKSFRDDYLTLLENFSKQVESSCDPERTVDFRKSITNGRYEIGKRIASGNTQVGEIHQEFNTGDDVSVDSTELTLGVGEAQIQETRRQMREMSKEKFYRQMKTFSKKRLVILLDTCEWLNEPTGVEAGQWAVDELIPELHYSFCEKGQQCYVVMASRVPLQLNCVHEQDRDEMKLGMLTKPEVDQYLEQMEIQDPTIKDFIYNMTYGHPHSISIIYDIWEEQWEFNDTPLSVKDLPMLHGQFYEHALQDFVDKDVLQRLIKSPLDELTRYGVLLRRFNLPLLQAVFKEWLPNDTEGKSEVEARNRFNQLIRYPHVESIGNYVYVFHKLLREILAEFIRVQEPRKWKNYHQIALDFLRHDAGSALASDWYYHLLACDEAAGLSYWQDVQASKPPEYLNELREIARDRTLKLTQATLQTMDIHRDTTNNIV